MKRLLALLLTACLLCSLAPMAFAASNEAVSAANDLHDLGLFQGVGTDKDGTPDYDLDRAPNRFEAVTMLVRLLGKEDEAKAGKWDTPFTDLTDWAKPYVGYAYANKLTNGVSDTKFGGTDTVTASQYLTFVLRALGYESGKDFQWDKAWELSDKLVFTKGQYNASSAFTRGDVAIVSNNALSVKLKDGGVTLKETLGQTTSETANGTTEVKAWYEVTGQGALLMKTDIDISQWDGVGLLSCAFLGNGKYTYDWEPSDGMIAEKDVSNLLSNYENSVTSREMKLYVFPLSGENWSEIHDAFEVLMNDFIEALANNRNSFEKTIADFSDQIGASVTLNKTLTIQNEPDAYAIESFSVSPDEENAQETYTAALDIPIDPTGSYSLLYRFNGKKQKSKSSALNIGDGVLTFTRELGHFSSQSTEGTFYVVHGIYSVDDSGNATYHRSVSAGYPYSFE